MARCAPVIFDRRFSFGKEIFLCQEKLLFLPCRTADIALQQSIHGVLVVMLFAT
jgi:hypothetical protein